MVWRPLLVTFATLFLKSQNWLELVLLLLNALVFLLALILFVPTIVLFIECSAALWTRVRPELPPIHKRIRTTLLIPAHNEAPIIAATLKGLLNQLSVHTEILVVADNCQDETASIARQFGVAVAERHDPTRIGKAYALSFGVQFLQSAPPDVVVILDADCRVTPGAIEKLAYVALHRNGPVQATYLLKPPAQSSPNDSLSAFAFLVKNHVRPLGLHNLRQPCLLTGSGMAFPWDIICNIPLAMNNIVEDMQLGLDLALAGTPPYYCSEAIVTGDLPHRNQQAFKQRTRWEHGHIHTLLTQMPRLLKGAFSQRRFDLFSLALEQCIPPLALLVALWGGALFFALGLTLMGMSWFNLILLLIIGAFLCGAIMLAWIRFGYKILPAKILLTVPLYVLWKIPLYFNFMKKRQTAWIRTERD